MIYIITLLFGLLFGSFLNVCIHRIPRVHCSLTDDTLTALRQQNVPDDILTQLASLTDQDYIGEDALFDALEDILDEEQLQQYGREIVKNLSRQRESIVFPGSHCPQCGAPISPWDNIPVLSFLILRGRCRHCSTPISPRYPLVESLTAVLFLLVVHHFAVTPQSLIYLALTAALIVISFIDIDYTIIPDVISLPGILAGLLLSPFSWTTLRWQNSVFGAFTGGGIILLIVYLGPLIFKQDAMGLGDAKLMAMIGAFLGWKLALLTIFLGALLGSLVGVAAILFKRTTFKSYLPFGPFLCSGAFIALLWGERLFFWYWNLFALQP